MEHLAVLFYTDDCDECDEILEELETIDDDTDKQGNKHPANTKKCDEKCDNFQVFNL